LKKVREGFLSMTKEEIIRELKTHHDGPIARIFRESGMAKLLSEEMKTRRQHGIQ